MLNSFFNQSFLIIVTEKMKVKLASAIPIGAATTLTDKKIQTLPLVTLKTIKMLSM